MKLKENIEYKDIVRLTPGYVGADIQTLCKEASIIAVERIINNGHALETSADEELENNVYIDIEDFRVAAKRVNQAHREKDSRQSLTPLGMMLVH